MSDQHIRAKSARKEPPTPEPKKRKKQKVKLTSFV